MITFLYILIWASSIAVKEGLPTVAKTKVRDPPRVSGWVLAHCPPSGEWGPGGNTGEIKAARKGTGHPTLHYITKPMAQDKYPL